MKFDTIIIGGGLSGLVTGIELAKKGQKSAIISYGQSSLHFFSGSFDLLGYDAEKQVVENPLEAVHTLDDEHPYKKVGVENIETYALGFQKMLEGAGVDTKGDAHKNHLRLTPLGTTKPAWLTLSELATVGFDGSLPWKNVGLVNIYGFMDFPVDFFADMLKKSGVECDVKNLKMEKLEDRRESPSENRASNIAKCLDNEEDIELMAKKLNELADSEEVLLMPAVLGVQNTDSLKMLQKKVNKPLLFLTTLPPSVSGMRLQYLLRKEFVKLGGTFLTGDEVTEEELEENTVKSLRTKNLEDDVLVADNYVLATGSFKSRGLCSDFNKVYEPVFGLDVESLDKRVDWAKDNVFEDQPYMHFGVKTDTNLHAMKNGQVMTNLFVAGSILSGHNSIKQADATGVSIMTAMKVANTIIK